MWAHCAKISVGLASVAVKGRRPTLGNIIPPAIQSAYYPDPNAIDTLNHEPIRNKRNLLETRASVLLY
jgi:hypothetical protein